MGPQNSSSKLSTEIKGMDQRLYDLEERITSMDSRITSMDSKLTQVVDAILGNPLTKAGGFIKELEETKARLKVVEDTTKKQEEFKSKIAWFGGIIVGALVIFDQASRIYSTFFQ